ALLKWLSSDARGRADLAMTGASLGWWSLRAAALLAVAAIASVATLFAVWVSQQDQPIPLTAELGREWDAMSKVFDSRIRERFPPGSSEAAMIEALRRQGFVATEWTAASTRTALRTERRFPCVYYASVEWTATAGTITSIGGSYGSSCL